MDPKSGFCRDNNTFYSLRPTPNLPPLGLTSYIFSLIPNPPLSSPALVDASAKSHLSYGDLRSLVSSISFSLQSEFAIQKDDVVLILSPPSIYVPIIYLSFLSLGAIISPSNPVSTKSEIEHQIQISKPVLIFSHSSTAHKIPAQNRVILIDSHKFHRLIESPRSSPKRVTIEPDDPATILYSSGTTGGVKGVILTHRNYTAVLAELWAARVEKRTCLFITVPIFHVFGFTACLKGLAFGETVVLMGEGTFEVRFVCRAVEEWRVTHLAAAPPVLAAIGRGDEAVGFDLGSLEVVGSGLGKEVIGRFRARFPWLRVVQRYGLTETSGGIYRTLTPEECLRYGSSGRLSGGFEVRIVDPNTLQPLPPCHKGELWVRGPTIMKGYIGNEEATTSILDSEGWLKTGDLCYIDNEGYLFVVDRLKELIKYKAYQVAPADLEGILLSHLEIADAAVVPYPDEEAG
ncbi:4-coumarate--CoA ligase-like 9 isoform X1 [Amborella trichopoda]|uniref:4-coumarate--CoA ligase-like 9 isoform X1 n=1 Tax=Amborella trichopoda TaxID=13333 RepID=UPI0009BD0B7F|nr:4-coumarate--CoA ligase-like 9 isoform X1 [Amborella trichopoda]|eukprot:XP_020527588.1 4-coumarate--CoA ligase-like 9 isoform X1 [Amborella trichopoda]